MQFSTLESSVDTTQTVSRKRRSSPKNKIDELFNLVDFTDLIVENRIPTKLATIWSDLVFNDGSRCVGDGSVLPAELVDSLKVCAKFVRAWIESAIVAESSEMDCHVRVVINDGVIDVVVGGVVVVVVVVVVVHVDVVVCSSLG